MKIGLCSANAGSCADPEVLTGVAEQAEALGFESLWVSEHLVLADPRVPPSPMEPTDPILEPITALAYVAARTRRLRLGTGVVVLPLRNPLVVAKALATLDVVSGGRLIFGIGVGYAPAEFRAIGVPLADRGRRTDEYLQAIRAVWTEDRPSYSGRYFSFDGIQAHPRPVQKPHPPVVIGGWSPPALRRAVVGAQGWFGWGLDHDATAAALAFIESETDRGIRDPRLGPLEITITPPGSIGSGEAAAYADLGVDRITLQIPGGLDPAGAARFLERTASTLM